MSRIAALAIVIAALAAERPARADGELRLAVDGAVARARRKIAIGPMIGVGGAYDLGGSRVDVPIGFGLGLDLFKIAVLPSAEEIQELILDTVKQRVSQQIEDLIARGEPAPDADEVRSMGEEIAAKLRDEYLGKRPRHRLLERPQLAIALEELRLPSTQAWMTRFTIGIGVSKVTIGPSIGYTTGELRGLFLGGELAVHLTPRGGPRSPVIDLYVRADRGMTGGAREHDLVIVGARALLDLI